MQNNLSLFNTHSLVEFSASLPLLKSGNFLIDLNDYYGLLKVSGQDAQSFLQGQLSCDLREVTEETSPIGAYCNAQGRIISTFRIFSDDNAYYLRMPQDSVETTLSALKKYSIFSKITLENASNSLIKLGLFIRDDNGNSFPFSLPQSIHQCHREKDWLIIRSDENKHRYEIYTSLTKAKELLTHCLDQNIHLAKNELWRLLDIRQGIPNVYQATQELFLPHRMNYHLIGGLHFQKGCYVGQEIIARLHYRGQLKHHMYRLEITTPASLKPGVSLYNQSKQEIGQIVDAVKISDTTYEALAILTIQESTQTSLIINDTPASPQLLSLPYSFTN